MWKHCFFILAMGASLFGQNAPQRAPFIRASGEGVVTIKPDQARVNVGVNTQAATAEEATQRNAETVTNVLAEIRRVIGTQGEIRTIGFNVSPVYRVPVQGQPAVISGYAVSNTVEITMNDVNAAGRVLDAGVKAGANTIGGIRFSLRDPQPVRAQALRLATQQARAQADAIAQGLGGRTGRVLAASDSTSVSPVTSIRDSLGAAGSVSTPVETGTLEVRATVTIETEIVIL